MQKPSSLNTLLERAESWPEEAQAELAQFVIETEVKHFGVYRLSDEERRAVQAGLEEARQGKFATDEEAKTLFDRYRRG